MRGVVNITYCNPRDGGIRVRATLDYERERLDVSALDGAFGGAIGDATSHIPWLELNGDEFEAAFRDAYFAEPAEWQTVERVLDLRPGHKSWLIKGLPPPPPMPRREDDRS